MSANAELNRQIDELLTKAEVANPGHKLHAQRVAVYSVATAERLGLSDDELLTVRVAAELKGQTKLPKHLAELIPSDGPIPQIVRLCDQFVRGQSIGGQGLSWLQYEAFHHFAQKHVAALRAIEPLITPADIEPGREATSGWGRKTG